MSPYAPPNDVHGQHQKDDKPTNTSSERYAPKPKASKINASAQLVEQPPVVKRMGRRKTGRNIQFNQSVTAKTANAFYEMQSKLNIPMGAVLERAIKALQASEKQRRTKKGQ